jgi:protein-tyrosine phosphatase
VTDASQPHSLQHRSAQHHDLDAARRPAGEETDRSPARTLRIMTVCTGNICRSPIAEVVLRDRLEAAGLADRVIVDSSGVSSEEHGNPMDRRARAVLASAGYTDAALDQHVARQVDAADLGERDLLLPMTAAHASALRRLAERSGQPDSVGDIVMFRTFDPAAPATRGAQDEHLLDVEDPWYGDASDFDACLAQVEAAVDGIVGWARVRLGEG